MGNGTVQLALSPRPPQSSKRQPPRILRVTTAFQVVDSDSLAPEVTDWRGVFSSTLDATSAEPESQQGVGHPPPSFSSVNDQH